MKNLRSIPLVEWIQGRPEWCASIDLLPNLKHILHAWDAPIGESRISVLQPGAKVEEHVDVDFYWKHRLRVHLVLQTNSNALFGCEGQVLSLPPGQVWVSNNWAPHWIANSGTTDRIHIVIDTLGSPILWKWINQGWKSTSNTPCPLNDALCTLPFHQKDSRPRLEQFSKYDIRTNEEVEEIINDCLLDIEHQTGEHELLHCRSMLSQFAKKWQQIECSTDTEAKAQQLRLCLEDLLKKLPNPKLWNGLDLHSVFKVQIGSSLYALPSQYGQ